MSIRITGAHGMTMSKERRTVIVGLPGKPAHFRTDNEQRRSVCGIPWVEFFAWDARDVNCVRCMKTKAWKRAMGRDN